MTKAKTCSCVNWKKNSFYLNLCFKSIDKNLDKSEYECKWKCMEAIRIAVITIIIHDDALNISFLNKFENN